MSEMILKTTFVPLETARGVAVFPNAEAARDAVDVLAKLAPAYVEYYDGRLISQALEQGNTYEWLKDTPHVGAALTFGFDDFNAHARQRQLKKAVKLLEKVSDTVVIATSETYETDVLEAFRGVISAAALPPLHGDRSGPLLVDGFHVPLERFEEFLGALAVLEKSLHVELPLYGCPLTGYFSIRPILSLQKVGDKQKVFKTIDQLNAVLAQFDGKLVSGGAEGRLLSRFVRAGWTEEYTQLVDAIRKVFDPYGILNPEVKAATDLRDLVKQLRSDNSIGL